MTDEERKNIIWHWDPVEERIYTVRQFENLHDQTIKTRCTDVSNYDWVQLLENPVEGKHIGNNPETSRPSWIDNPEPTAEELLQNEREEKRRYLEETNTDVILYLQQLMTPMTLSEDSAAPVMSVEEYSEMNAKRLQYAERIKEIDAALSAAV